MLRDGLETAVVYVKFYPTLQLIRMEDWMKEQQ